jgi:hypothetical protein
MYIYISVYTVTYEYICIHMYAIYPQKILSMYLAIDKWPAFLTQIIIMIKN